MQKFNCKDKKETSIWREIKLQIYKANVIGKTPKVTQWGREKQRRQNWIFINHKSHSTINNGYFIPLHNGILKLNYNPLTQPNGPH